MDFTVTTISPADDRYDTFLAALREPTLARQMWDDAEHDACADPAPGTVWSVVASIDPSTEGRGFTPVAWAGSYVTEVGGVKTLRCCDSYERRGRGRVFGLYALAYRHRHRRRVAPLGLPAVTYLYAQPIPLHEADGWYRTGNHGTSDHGHDWWELRRDPS